jgi:FlaG/FlaF family flagellin (archaellin)
LKQFTSGDVNIGEIQITGIDYLENNYKGTREVIVDNVELKSTEIAKTANGTNYPKFIKLTVQGAKVPLAEFPSNSQPKIKELIQADTIGINFGIQFDADHTNNSASANISLGAKRLGDVNLSVSLVNVPKNLYELGTSTVNSRNIAIKQLLKQGKLSDITIGYEEKGGVARMLEMQAKEEGTSPHKLTEKMIIIAQSDAKKSGSKQEQEIAEQLAVFLRNPKSLSINSKPIQPIALQIFPEMFLFDRGKLTELLDIKVVVNK